MIVVSDTSAISNLYQIGLVDLLNRLYGVITIPPAVKRELYRIPEHANSIDQIDWIRVVPPSNQHLILELSEELDLGESEAIALAIEHQARYLIIDEYRGRAIADQYGVKIIGILGVLIQAKQANLIKTVNPYILHLREIGFRLNQNLIDTVLKRLGER